MKPKSIIRNIIILVAVIILGVIGYKVFLAKKAPASTSSLQTTAGAGAGTSTAASDTTSSTTASVGQDFLASLLNIQSIKLDDTLFSSPAFAVLQDFNRPIPPDTNPGRPNPFAPIGVDTAATSVQVSTSIPSSVTSKTSTLNGTLSVGDPTATRWFEYGTTPSLGTMTPPKSQANPGTFAEQIAGLLPNTTYYVRAAALIGGLPVSGNTVQWKTALASR